MSELRWNPLLGEWVATATHRQERTFMPPADYCPLCPTKPGGFPTEVPEPTYDIVVFENRFPSLRPDPAPPAVEGTELYPVRLAGLGGGVVQMVSGLAKLVGPLILAFIAGSNNLLSPAATEAAITPGFLTLASVAVIGAIAMLALRYETNGVRMVTDEDEIAGAAGGGRRKAKST